MGIHWLWSVQLSLEPLHSVQLTYYVRDMRRCRLGLLRCMGCPAGKVVSLDQEAGKSFSYEEIKNAVETNKPAVLFLCQVCIHCPAGAPLGTGRPPSRQSSSCARRVRRPAGAPLGTGQPCCVVFQSCSGEHARVPRELSIYGSGSNAHGLELPHPPAAHACAETHRRCLPTMQHSTVRTMQ